MKTVTFELTGITPLVQHNPASSMQKRSETLARKVIPSPEEEAEAAAYRLPSKQLYLPALAVQASLMNACKGRRIGKFAAASIVAGAVFLTEDILPLVNPKTKKPQTDYSIDTRRAVVQKQGVLRSRPKIENWQGKITFEYDDEVMKPDLIQELLTVAGSRIGLLELSPHTKAGQFGRFTAAIV